MGAIGVTQRKREAATVVSTITIEVTAEDRLKVWGLIEEYAWSGRYLGKNRFVVTEEQENIIRGAGLTIRTV